MGIVPGWWRADEQYETSWQGRLQQRLKLARIAVPDEEAVRVVAIGQRDSANIHALLSDLAGKRLCCRPTTAVCVGIENQIDGSRMVAQLPELDRKSTRLNSSHLGIS